MNLQEIFIIKKKILDWILAGLTFWSSIQHNDGSFDEFYPNERGWVGPTAFTTFTSIEALNLIKEDIPNETLIKIKNNPSCFIFYFERRVRGRSFS